jgi:hypothetical protein
MRRRKGKRYLIVVVKPKTENKTEMVVVVLVVVVVLLAVLSAVVVVMVVVVGMIPLRGCSHPGASSRFFGWAVSGLASPLPVPMRQPCTMASRSHCWPRAPSASEPMRGRGRGPPIQQCGDAPSVGSRGILMLCVCTATQ